MAESSPGAGPDSGPAVVPGYVSASAGVVVSETQDLQKRVNDGPIKMLQRENSYYGNGAANISSRVVRGKSRRTLASAIHDKGNACNLRAWHVLPLLHVPACCAGDACGDLALPSVMGTWVMGCGTPPPPQESCVPFRPYFL